MNRQKSKSTFSATLLALIMGVSVFMAGQVWAAKMVKDPSTGKMVSKPVYGGTLTTMLASDIAYWDTYQGAQAAWINSYVYEKLAYGDWAADRSVYPFTTEYVPFDAYRGHLIESWEETSPTSFTVKLRQGVHWQNKAPMNGRELVAKDVEFSYHRMTGLGSGFTKPGACPSFTGIPWKSITATDKYTVKVELKEPNLSALPVFITESYDCSWVHPPEVIKKHGDLSDWKTWVGSGPWMIEEHVRDSHVTLNKNPDYWAHDEKYPENKLPYADSVVIRIIPDPATQIAALRTGKVDHHWTGMSLSQAQDLKKTNPEIIVQALPGWAESAGLRLDFEPFKDIRVRKAMQMAIDLKAINDNLYGGLGDPTPAGQLGKAVVGYRYPYEEWPQWLRDEYAYNPKKAKQLLVEAGYPDGFEVTYDFTSVHNPYTGNPELAQVLAAYWSQIGVKTKLNPLDHATYQANVNSKSFSPITHFSETWNYDPVATVNIIHSEKSQWTASMAGKGSRDLYPEHHLLAEMAQAAKTHEEQKFIVKAADKYSIEQHWMVFPGVFPNFVAYQPWIKGYNGERQLGGGSFFGIISARVWIDKN